MPDLTSVSIFVRVGFHRGSRSDAAFLSRRFRGGNGQTKLGNQPDLLRIGVDAIVATNLDFAKGVADRTQTGSFVLGYPQTLRHFGSNY